jgi:hypothetical protein
VGYAHREPSNSTDRLEHEFVNHLALNLEKSVGHGGDAMFATVVPDARFGALKDGGGPARFKAGEQSGVPGGRALIAVFAFALVVDFVTFAPVHVPGQSEIQKQAGVVGCDANAAPRAVNGLHFVPGQAVIKTGTKTGIWRVWQVGHPSSLGLDEESNVILSHISCSGVRIHA